MSKDVRSIVRAWLESHGYDGLYSWRAECGCECSDLMPCDEYTGDCAPGKKVACEPEECPADGECDWHVEKGPRHQTINAIGKRGEA